MFISDITVRYHLFSTFVKVMIHTRQLQLPMFQVILIQQLIDIVTIITVCAISLSSAEVSMGDGSIFFKKIIPAECLIRASVYEFNSICHQNPAAYGIILYSNTTMSIFQLSCRPQRQVRVGPTTMTHDIPHRWWWTVTYGHAPSLGEIKVLSFIGFRSI